jgi:Mrp family chromosome partitioning ATPase
MEPQSAEWLAEVRQARLVLSGQALRTIGIASPISAGGVSKLARALAAASVEAGQRTLLLSLGNPAGSAHDAGSRDAGSQDAGSQDAAQKNGAGYDVIGREGRPGIPFYFHNPAALKAGFASLAETYDAVFVDMPPVLDDNADVNAVSVARACDGVLLLCVSERVAVTEIAQAHGMLTAAGVNIIGTVLDEEFSPPLSESLARAVYRMTWFIPYLGRRLYKKIQSAQSLQAS